MAASKTAALNRLATPQYKLQLATPVRAILDCEFVDGSGSDERLILHRHFLTYLLYHIFLIFSTNYPCSTFKKW